MIYKDPLELFRSMFGLRNISTKNNVQSAVLALGSIALRGKENFLFCQSLIRYQPKTRFSVLLFPIGWQHILK
jgi:hypothetical protein